MYYHWNLVDAYLLFLLALQTCVIRLYITITILNTSSIINITASDTWTSNLLAMNAIVTALDQVNSGLVIKTL